jgi:hypothetical protein
MLLGFGWNPLTILALQQIVDPQIRNISVAMFLFIQNIVNCISAKVMGDSYSGNDVEGMHINGSEYGSMMTLMTVLPCALSIPFYFLAGYSLK